MGWVQVNGDLAYVQLMDANPGNMESYAVVDLPSGRVLHQGTGTVPELLVPNRVWRLRRARARGDGPSAVRSTSACRGLAASGGCCVGRAVIVGINTQARHGVQLW